MNEQPTATRAPAPAPARAPARGSRTWWSAASPVPTGRTVVVVAVVAVLALASPGWAVLALLLLVAAAAVLDAAVAPAPWRVGVARELPGMVPLDTDAELRWRIANPVERRLTVTLADELAPSLQASTRRLEVTLPPAGRATARARIRPQRRGTFHPTELTVRTLGPLGLVSRQAVRELPGHLEVHPSFRSRDAAELRIRRARLLEEGQRSVRGRGGGTEFEALREYVQGDEFRHVDWAATARAGTPIVRTFRAERNQTVLVLLDTGRTVAGLVDGVPRLDHAMDATLALATVATHLGDRTGLLAFGADVRALVPPRRDRSQLRRLSTAMHTLEPELAEAGYRAAFHATLARFRRRAFVVLLTDLANEAVQETLLPTLPVLARDHAVVVASVRDPALRELRDRHPERVEDAYAAAAAASVDHERERAAALLRGAGVRVVDAGPDELASRLTDAYLELKVAGGW